MKKLTVLLSLVALFAFTTNTFAQGKMSGGIHVGAALPMGDFADVAKTGFGGGVDFGYWVKENIKAGASVSYLMFGKKAGSETTMIPISVFGNYYFGGNDKFKPFGTLKLGYAMTTTKVKILAIDTEKDKNKLSWGLGAGLIIC